MPSILHLPTALSFLLGSHSPAHPASVVSQQSSCRDVGRAQWERRGQLVKGVVNSLTHSVNTRVWHLLFTQMLLLVRVKTIANYAFWGNWGKSVSGAKCHPVGSGVPISLLSCCP